MGFPILRIPYVPFRDILRMMEFSDLISISLCSQRCHNVTKRNLYMLKKWEICVIRDRNPRIILQKGKEKREILGVSFGESLSKRQRSGAKLELNRIGNTLFRVEITPQGYLTSYWPTDRIGLFECGKYVADLLQKEIHTVEFGDKSTWLLDLPAYIPQKSISKVVFCIHFSSGFEMNSLLRVFEKCSSEHFEIFGFVHEAPRLIRYGSFRTFRILNGLWLNVRHVTTMKCTHISLLTSLWESVHLNKFLRRWIHRGMPRLESFDISIVYDIHIEEILDGLDQFVMRNASFRGIGKRNKRCTFYQLQIESKCESIALIHVNTAEKVFRMVVNK